MERDRDDDYLSVTELAAYSNMSRRWLMSRLHHPVSPIPHFKVGQKLLVKRSEFDAWLRQFRVQHTPIDVDAIVAEVVGRGAR